MLQGHVGNTSIKTAGYGTLHVRTVPASTLATTRLNMSERVSVVGHDVPLFGHVSTTAFNAMTGFDVSSGDTDVCDCRGTKSESGIYAHHAPNETGLRQLLGCTSGGPLHEGETCDDGHCRCITVEYGEGDKPIHLDLTDELHAALSRYIQQTHQGGITQKDLCGFVGRVSRATPMPHVEACLLALTPLTHTKRVVFETFHETPQTVFVGARRTREDSAYIKHQFLGLAAKHGAGVYEAPLPPSVVDERVLQILELPHDEKGPLWVHPCSGGMFVYDKPNGKDRRLRSLFNSSDFPGRQELPSLCVYSGHLLAHTTLNERGVTGESVDETADGNAQVHTFAHIGKLQFYVRNTNAECANSTVNRVGIPIHAGVQVALLIIRNAFAQQAAIALKTEHFAALAASCQGNPGVMCLKPPSKARMNRIVIRSAADMANVRSDDEEE